LIKLTPALRVDKEGFFLFMERFNFSTACGGDVALATEEGVFFLLYAKNMPKDANLILFYDEFRCKTIQTV
jgi:hypothetical protein